MEEINNQNKHSQIERREYKKEFDAVKRVFGIVLIIIALFLLIWQFPALSDLGFVPSPDVIAYRLFNYESVKALTVLNQIELADSLDSESITPNITQELPNTGSDSLVSVDSINLAVKDTVLLAASESTKSNTEKTKRSHDALEYFNGALFYSTKNLHKTRILLIGDSITDADFLGYYLRRELQRVFGNGGLGFVKANLCKMCAPRGLEIETSGDYKELDMVKHMPSDSMLGPSGNAIEFQSPFDDEFVEISKVEFKGILHEENFFAIYYLKQPGGAEIELIVNDSLKTRFSTESSEKELGVFRIHIPLAVNEYKISPLGDGLVRIFGYELLNGNEGITLETMSNRGARLSMLKNMDNEHFRMSLDEIMPDLILIMMGTNESGFDSVPSWFKYNYRNNLKYVKELYPETSHMLLSVLDRAVRDQYGIHTKESIPQLVSSQKFAAKQAEWAFFNTYESIGGEGTYSKWIDMEKPLVEADLTHPTPSGYRVVGRLIAKELIDQYNSAEFVPSIPPDRKIDINFDFVPDGPKIKLKKLKKSTQTNINEDPKHEPKDSI